jgi:putative tricarboxylic transport membrane protein
MPAIAAALLFALSLFTFFIELKGSSEEEGKCSLKWKQLTKPMCLLISLIGYAFLLNIVGYIVATFLLMSILFLMTEQQEWRKDLVIAVIVSTLSYLVFNKWLHVPLPSGMFFTGW